MSLAVVDDPLFDEHRPPGPHPERPERLAAARRAAASVTARAERVNVPTRLATDDEIGRVHTAAYVHRLGQAAGVSGMWDEDTYSSPKSVDAARTAAGGAVELVDTLVGRRAERGVALLRPPGHHARPGGAMGFCLLNNVAIAAAHARARGVGRVLVLDFDVHHGNGTQEMFYDDPNVLFVSLHQFPFYPGTGALEEAGKGDGLGFTVNVPLSAGTGDAEYALAFERIVAPVASEFTPELVLLSAGFDAHESDPLAQMRVTSEGYRAMMRKLCAALPERTPIGAVLEGGYDLAALEASLEATLEVLVGLDATREEQRDRKVTPSANVSPQLREAQIERARVSASEHWRLG
jgi:acetoin utilization deacetylase AcuC-like enzyme